MDLHRVAYRVTFNYFRGSEIPLSEFDLYVRLVTAMLRDVDFETAIESITGENYTSNKITGVRKEIAESIIETINYKNIKGYIQIDLPSINKEYSKTEYEGGFLQGLLGRKYVRQLDHFYTLEEYDTFKEAMSKIEKISVIPIKDIEKVIQLKDKFNEIKTWFHMFSDKQIDKFFLLLDEDIRRGDTQEVLTKKMTERTIYGRINRDWVDFHKSTDTFEEKLEKVLDYTFELHRLPKTVRMFYSLISELDLIITSSKLTLKELQDLGFLTNIREENLYSATNKPN